MAPPSPTGTPDPPLAGLGRFAWKVGLGTVIAIGLALAGLRLLAPRPAEEAPPAAGAPPGRVAATGPAAPPLRAVAPEEPAAVLTFSETAREVERRHAAGELADAQRRFEACPGGDRRRLAWLDAEGRVLKLARETSSGWTVVEWFDGAGRLREALLSRPAPGGAGWARRVVVDERGEERGAGTAGPGLAPEVPPPPLVRREPARAFFSGAGCDGAR